jgi:hypothetical protein
MTKTVDYNLKVISQIPDTQALFSYLIKSQQLHLTVWLLMVRRQLLLEHRVYFTKCLTGEDFYWHFEIWPHLRTVKMLNLNLYAYCHRQGSITTQKDLLAPYLDFDKTFTHWKGQCEQGYANAEAILAFLANIWVNRGYRFYRLKGPEKAVGMGILRKHVDLLDHAATPKAKRTVKLLHLVGLRATVFILGWYWRLRSLIKGNAI